MVASAAVADVVALVAVLVMDLVGVVAVLNVGVVTALISISFTINVSVKDSVIVGPVSGVSLVTSLVVVIS